MYFCKLNIGFGYHQIRLQEDSIPFSPFKTRYRNFEFLVLSFRFTNALANSMNVLKENVKDQVDLFVIFYVDDILIYIKTWKNCVGYIRTVYSNYPNAFLELQK